MNNMPYKLRLTYGFSDARARAESLTEHIEAEHAAGVTNWKERLCNDVDGKLI